MLRDLIIPVCILAVIASVVLPLPPSLIDFMLVGNVILALVLLVSTLYISCPLKLSSLPSILLLTTLYRLALNISTTRLILSTGSAGSLIQAFGEVVIQGKVIVGLVIFLVITLIQFIVIAKGSERVAEVSARFTLDALPGKQMSIDADVRSGLIDVHTAKEKRQNLQMESRFYGALDGAMKFVKGDAIAGLIITAINITGGFGIGILVNGMDLSSAINQYTLLTVGDGLLSQIPALLNSLAAGMIVTRVARGDDNSLTRELLSQVSQVRTVLFLVGIVSFILAFLPGLPALPFITLSLILIFNGLLQKESSKADLESEAKNVESKIRVPEVLQIDFGKDLAKKLVLDNEIDSILEDVKSLIFNQEGILLKTPKCSVNKNLNNEIAINIRGILVKKIKLSDEDDFSKTLIKKLTQVILENSLEFIDDAHTRRLLDNFEDEMHELINGLIPDVLKVTELTKVLKSLNEEKISIRNIDVILQAIAEHGSGKVNQRALLEEVRVSLKRFIANEFSENFNISQALALKPQIDLHFAKAEKEGEEIDVVLLSKLANEIKKGSYKLLVVSKSSRRILFECLSMHSVSLPVVAYEEIPENYKLKIDFEFSEELSKESYLEHISWKSYQFLLYWLF